MTAGANLLSLGEAAFPNRLPHPPPTNSPYVRTLRRDHYRNRRRWRHFASPPRAKRQAHPRARTWAVPAARLGLVEGFLDHAGKAGEQPVARADVGGAVHDGQ